jgi:hypothetical protein
MICAYRFSYRIAVFTKHKPTNTPVTNGLCCMPTCNFIHLGITDGNNAVECEIHFLRDCEYFSDLRRIC